ncbi:hypothetical protein AB0M20_41910, partial [Actinoplanes sp. NPDC051633]|uniref:hypothetical protein n=1 Tax=Actinoplanes sp. NPDC051633 TaxID=3155670 RepID=UPI00343F0EF3
MSTAAAVGNKSPVQKIRADILRRADEIRRVGIACIALIVLLRAAAPGGRQWMVTLFFAIFVATATVWLSRQYTDSLTGDRAHLNRAYWFALFGVAGLLIAAHYLVAELWNPVGWSGLGLIGVFGVYLLFGDAVAGSRSLEPDPIPSTAEAEADARIRRRRSRLRLGLIWSG